VFVRNDRKGREGREEEKEEKDQVAEQEEIGTKKSVIMKERTIVSELDKEDDP
jgi:hypothetical protein